MPKTKPFDPAADPRLDAIVEASDFKSYPKSATATAKTERLIAAAELLFAYPDLAAAVAADVDVVAWSPHHSADDDAALAGVLDLVRMYKEDLEERLAHFSEEQKARNDKVKNIRAHVGRDTLLGSPLEWVKEITKQIGIAAERLRAHRLFLFQQIADEANEKKAGELLAADARRKAERADVHADEIAILKARIHALERGKKYKAPR